VAEYTWTGVTPVFYPMLADYPEEGLAQNLEAEPGDTVNFAVDPPAGWVPAEPKKTNKKVTE
jgi:hypothetical protein